MGLQSETRTIGDTTYRVTQLPAGKSRRLLVRLYKVLGPAFGKLLEGFDATSVTGGGKAPSLLDIKMESVSQAMSTLAIHLTEEDLEFVVDRLFTGDMVEMDVGDDKWVKLTKERVDLHFAGKLDEMFRLLAFALEVNYASFFAGSGGASAFLAKLATPTPSQSKSPQT